MRLPVLILTAVLSVWVPRVACAGKTAVVHSVGVTSGAAFVASSTGDEIRDPVPPENAVKVNTAVPAALRYAFYFTDSAVPHYLPGGYQGVSLGVLNLGGLEKGDLSRANKYIGYPVMAYVFQGAPFHHFNSALSLGYEWNFGASFGWQPYSELNKNFNLTVGSRVNAYLNLALCLRWQIDDHFNIFGGPEVSHFSNGNTSFPNPGVNSFGIRVGVDYTINPHKGRFKPAVPDTAGRKKVEFDLSAWGASRRRVYKGGETPVLLPGHFACAGVSFAPMVPLNAWWRVGGALDVQWDQSSDMKRNYIEGSTTEDIRFATPSFWRQLTVGVSAHGELRMPVFGVNVGCGYNLVAPWENRGFYQNITLRTYIFEKIFLNIGYQLRNFHQQSSLMLGAGITI